MAVLMLMTLTIVVSTVFANDAAMDNSDMLPSNSPFQQLLARVNALEVQDKIQQNRITELESRDRVQQKLISDLEDVVRHQQQLLQMEDLKHAPTDGINHTNAHQKDENGEIKTTGLVNLNNGKDNRIRRQQSEVGTVAFTAVLVHARNDLGLDQNVVFDHVETNIGNGYNPHHGVFIAPISGTYVFHVTIFSAWNTDTRCTIAINGVRKASAYAHGDSGRHDQGSQTLVVRLNQGDDVAIQNMIAHDNVFGNGDLWTTFSGFLLRSDAEATTIVG